MHTFKEMTMDIYTKIKDSLNRYGTQKELSKRTGISEQTISSWVHGTRAIGGMRLDTFLKLFPNATIILDGERVGQHIMAGRDAAGHDIVHQAASPQASFAAVFDSLSSAGLCDACLVKALAAVRRQLQ